ncbi:MAG: LysR family transcriptional regulator [Anaeromyxobacteraceae bacterium]
MELQLLRTFIAIARSGSVTRATQALFLSQPAVSAQLKALEDEVRLQLFDRTPHGMKLTSAGAALLPEAERVLDAEARLLASAGRLSGSVGGRVRLGIPAAAFIPTVNPGQLRFGELMARISSKHPALLVEVHHGTSDSVKEDVRAGRLDLGIVVGHVEGEELERLRLKVLTAYVAAPAAWRDAIAKRGWAHVLESPWVVGAEDSFCGRAAREHARHPSRLIEVDHPGAVLELVSAGLCAGLVHEGDALEAERAGRIVVCREQPLSADLSAVWDRRAAGHMPLSAVLPILVELWRDVSEAPCPAQASPCGGRAASP